MTDVGGQSTEPRTNTVTDSRSDRCILRAEFTALEAKLPRNFTFDACCNDSGDNALCKLFASPSASFLDTDISGHNVWLNPPFAKIAQFVRHYLFCKAKSPSNTSACIMVPAWQGKHRKWLHGMTLLHRYEQGHVLFHAPQLHGGRSVLPGIPWPVEVWYDPPGRVVELDLQATSTDQPLMFRFQARAAGCAAKVLLDSGASHNFVSAAFVRASALRITAPVQAYTVRLASGDTVPLQGQCTFKLSMQQFSGTVTALVMPEMLPQTDLILGDTWLRSEQAQLCYTTGTCTLLKGSRRRTLSLSDGELPQTDDQVVHSVLAAMLSSLLPPLIISAKQTKKAIRQGAKHFTVLVRNDQLDSCDAQSPTGHSTPQAASAVAQDGTNEQSRIQVIVDKYKDVFEDLPPGLPPARNVVHTPFHWNQVLSHQPSGVIVYHLQN